MTRTLKTSGLQVLREAMTFSKDDLRVFRAFLDRKPAKGKRFETDGNRLDGGSFLSRVATWEQGERGAFVATHDLGSRTAQQIHRKLRKMGGTIVREAPATAGRHVGEGKPVPYDDDEPEHEEDERDQSWVTLYDDEALQIMQGWTGGQSDPLYAISSMGGANYAWVFTDAISNIDRDLGRVKKLGRNKFQLGNGTFTKKEIDELAYLRDELQMTLDNPDAHSERDVGEMREEVPAGKYSLRQSRDNATMYDAYFEHTRIGSVRGPFGSRDGSRTFYDWTLNGPRGQATGRGRTQTAAFNQLITKHKEWRAIGADVSQVGEAREARGIYHDMSFSPGDYVLHFREDRSTWSVDRVDTGGTHSTIGSTRGFGTTEAVRKAIEHDAHVHSIGDASVYDAGGDQLGELKDGRVYFYPGSLAMYPYKLREDAVAHEAPRNAPGDEQAADELVLYIQNTSDLSLDGPRGQGHDVLLNALRKWKKGTYNPELAVKLFGYLAESGARRYATEMNGSDREWSTMFTPATRRMAAAELETQFRSSAENGEYDHVDTRIGGPREPVRLAERPRGRRRR